jgi:hypothetical protein
LLSPRLAAKKFGSIAAGALSAPAFYLHPYPTVWSPAAGNGTETADPELRMPRLLRVTNKLAMLSFGDNIWRPRRAALKFDY